MKTLAALAVAASLGLSVYAQDKLTESVEVRVVNVDVVVTDRAGKPVHGLTKEDFEVFESGKKQVITNLYEAAPEANATNAAEVQPNPAAAAVASSTVATPDPRRRRIIIFIDNYSLDPARRAEVLKSIERFIDQQKRPADEVALIAWNRSAKTVTPFTADLAPLRQGINTMRSQARGSLSFPQETERVRAECQRYYDQADGQIITFQDAFTQARGAVNAYTEEQYMTAKVLLDGLRTTLTNFAGMDGKKVLVFAGAHLPADPGADLFFWLYRTFQRQLRNLNAMQVVETPRSSQRINLEEVANQASADDVAMYFIDGGSPTESSQGVETSGHNLETSGLEQFLAVNNTADAFKRLAEVSGGAVVTRWQNFDVAFDTVSRDLNFYYSIGFKPESADLGGTRQINVKVKNPDYTVRARMLYTPKSLDTEITQHVIANLAHGGLHGDWPITLKTGAPERDGKYFKVPMEISLAPTLTLLPAGSEVAGGYTVYVVMGNAGGAMSKVMKTVQDVRMPAGAEQDARRQPFTFEGTLMVRPGENVLSVAVVDRVSNAVGYARTAVKAE